jgi:hypothetical protein
MTNEQWKELDQSLSGLFGKAELMVDGFRVSLYRERITKNRLGIVTYINGQWKGAWIVYPDKHPESRLLNHRTRRAYKKNHFKGTPKSLLKKYNIDPDRKIHHLDITWNSVASIRRQYEARFKKI